MLGEEHRLDVLGKIVAESACNSVPEGSTLNLSPRKRMMWTGASYTSKRFRVSWALNYYDYLTYLGA